ncbi:unnamed protein product [Linum tenue]|uniref:Cytochrome P450 n=1 Tax=Linum tenue TaxID=586396 RepID=A0AAV0M3Y8_9ROSI|nr:unnamed protein product [Linum tenue]
MHNLIGALPHHALRNLAAEYGPIVHLQLGEISAATWGCQNIAFSPHGEYWNQMKRISLTELLGPRKTRSLRGVREAVVSEMIESVRKKSVGRPVNLTETFLGMTNTITCKTAFGYQCVDQDEFLGLTRTAVQAAAGFNLADLYPSLGFLQGLTGLKNQASGSPKRVGPDLRQDHQAA